MRNPLTHGIVTASRPPTGSLTHLDLSHCGTLRLTHGSLSALSRLTSLSFRACTLKGGGPGAQDAGAGGGQGPAHAVIEAVAPLLLNIAAGVAGVAGVAGGAGAAQQQGAGQGAQEGAEGEAGAGEAAGEDAEGGGGGGGGDGGGGGGGGGGGAAVDLGWWSELRGLTALRRLDLAGEGLCCPDRWCPLAAASPRLHRPSTLTATS